jgi:hypothetical protein
LSNSSPDPLGAFLSQSLGERGSLDLYAAQIAPEERPPAAMFGAKVGSLHGEGDGVMAYDADAAIELEIERLRSKRHRYSERQGVLPAIKMIIGDWYVDELGMPTREITARE